MACKRHERVSALALGQTVKKLFYTPTSSDYTLPMAMAVWHTHTHTSVCLFVVARCCCCENKQRNCVLAHRLQVELSSLVERPFVKISFMRYKLMTVLAAAGRTT